jgi:capsular polysaccharide biosynthesis protein
MDFTYEKFFKILKENILLIIAGGLICFAAAFAYSKFAVDPIYYSDAKILIKSQKLQATQMSPTTELNYARMIVDSYLEILDSHDFYEQVYQSLPEEYKPNSPEELRRNTSLAVKDNTEVIQLEYKSTNKDQVQYITAKIVNNIGSYNALTQSYRATVEITESATVPLVSNNNLTLYSTIGFLFGMILIFMIAVVRDMLDTRVKTIKDIKDRYDLPVLGAIPTFKGKKIKKEESIDG